jgi:hypothetical protein
LCTELVREVPTMVSEQACTPLGSSSDWCLARSCPRSSGLRRRRSSLGIWICHPSKDQTTQHIPCQMDSRIGPCSSNQTRQWMPQQRMLIRLCTVGYQKRTLDRFWDLRRFRKYPKKVLPYLNSHLLISIKYRYSQCRNR